MIFPHSELETYGFAIELTDEETFRGLDRLARPQHLHRGGYGSGLKESHVEHSFVERVLGDVFGYTTLLNPENDGATPEIPPSTQHTKLQRFYRGGELAYQRHGLLRLDDTGISTNDTCPCDRGQSIKIKLCWQRDRGQNIKIKLCWQRGLERELAIASLKTIAPGCTDYGASSPFFLP